MQLGIIVGHDINQQGAMASSPLSKYEYEYNLEIAELVYRYAMSAGITSKIFLRNKIGIKGVYDNLKKWSTDDTVAVELHFNAFDKKTQGTETLFDNDPSDSIELARCIHLEVVSVFKRKGKADRGLKLIESGRGYLNLSLAKCPSCILEPFFGDNPLDAELGLKNKMKYAEAIVKGVAVYFLNREKMLSLN